MVFNSYIFILLFLPVILAIYYIFNNMRAYSASKALLIVSSLLFIGYGDIHSLYFLLVSALLTFMSGYFLLIQVSKGSMRFSKFILAAALALQIIILGYYKYTYFIVENLNRLINTSFSADAILIPAGISFITFQQISFLVDIYRKKITNLSFGDYFFYISYFPKLLQGPITGYNALITQINNHSNKRIKSENLSYGLWLFTTGLARKILLSDLLSKAVAWGYDMPISDITSADALIVSLCFTLQIYFDFSGYSHMALGISKMLNLDLPDNFDTPYKSASIIEFWKKWHISLTSFLREYLYFPLGGSRKGKLRTYLNIMLVFLISGLWHGSSWNYVLWGFMHGLAQCLNKVFDKQWQKFPSIIRWLLTFSFVNIAWIFFRASTVPQACSFIQKIFIPDGLAVSGALLNCFEISEIEFLAGKFPVVETFISKYPSFLMSAFLILCFALCLKLKDKLEQEFNPTVIKCIITIILFFWSVISLSTVVEFIYGGF